MLDFSWISKRGAGVLAHISALPSNQGIGSFGLGADRFIDFLKASGMKYWQICPLNPTGFGDSPYQSFSAFAGNSYFIDFNELIDTKLIDEADLNPLPYLPQDKCDFGKIYNTLPALLKKAAKNQHIFKNLKYEFSFEDFCAKNSFWLDDYALFCALKERFNGQVWNKWPDEFKFRTFKRLASDIQEEIKTFKIIQWIFYGQYENFKKKANAANIEIIGDMPIFLSYDSADVWTHPELFDLDENLSPKHVAGVGPDYFSPKGQLWGNPLYNWVKNKNACFEFWKNRLSAAFKMYDILRLDHFRGFADFWEIPASANDASKGKWKTGPDIEFFRFVRNNFPTQKFIAEDLGMLSEAAIELRAALKMPAMSVLQFAFGGDASNAYLPHNMQKNLVCYTGTHDNDTSISWYKNLPEKTKDQFRLYFSTPANSPHWDMNHAALFCTAGLAILPMQDILGLGAEARFNTPGEPAGNWQWRMTFSQLENATKNEAPFLKNLISTSGR